MNVLDVQQRAVLQGWDPSYRKPKTSWKPARGEFPRQSQYQPDRVDLRASLRTYLMWKVTEPCCTICTVEHRKHGICSTQWCSASLIGARRPDAETRVLGCGPLRRLPRNPVVTTTRMGYIVNTICWPFGPSPNEDMKYSTAMDYPFPYTRLLDCTNGWRSGPRRTKAQSPCRRSRARPAVVTRCCFWKPKRGVSFEEFLGKFSPHNLVANDEKVTKRVQSLIKEELSEVDNAKTIARVMLVFKTMYAALESKKKKLHSLYFLVSF